MCVLILLYGIATVSWYAELALRRRVSMSAIGSVIVIAWPSGLSRRGSRPCGPTAWEELPGRLGDAGQLAGVRHLADADPAQAEHAVDGARAAAARASGVAAHLELRLAAGLGDHRLGCHGLLLLER